jgi:bacteriorhodopsin
VRGTIRPQGSAVINIDRTIRFNAAKAAQLARALPSVAQAPRSGTPTWMWVALAVAVALLLALLLTVWRLARPSRRAFA